MGQIFQIESTRNKVTQTYTNKKSPLAWSFWGFFQNRLSYDRLLLPFSFLSALRHTHISIGRPHTDRFGNLQTLLSHYVKYSFHPWLLRMQRLPPLTNWLLVSFWGFPCGTHTIHVLQWNNRIFVRECTTLLLVRSKNGMERSTFPKCLNRRCGCACVLRTFWVP